MNKKISFPIAIIIIVLCAIVVGGIAVWQYLRAPEGEERLEGTPEDETADWKVYRNKEYGFEIKYPKPWYNHGTENDIFFLLYPTIPPIEEATEDYKCQVSISMLYIKQDYLNQIKEQYGKEDALDALYEEQDESIRLKEVYSSEISKTEEVAIEEINIGGMKGLKIHKRVKELVTNREYILIIYIVLDKNSGGAFAIRGDFYGEKREDCENYIDDFNQMPSTFKFID